MSFFDDLKSQFIEFLAQQAKLTKVIAGSIMGGVFLVLMIVIFMGQRNKTVAEYELLYGGMDAQNTNLVQEELKKSNTDFEKEEGKDGWSVKVPKGEGSEWRLKLATIIQAQGNGVGYELFDNNPFGATKFEQNIKKQRALMGELERDLQSMDFVRTAKVKLVIPEDSAFVEDQEPAKASVLLEVIHGAEITIDTVKTVQAHVANSVPHLMPSNVAVMDSLGNNLTEIKEPVITKREIIDDELHKTQSTIRIYQEQRDAYEKGLEKKITDSLSRVFGVGHASANVGVEFDYTRLEEKTKTYSPSGTPLSEGFTVTREGGPPTDNMMAEGITGSYKHIVNPPSNSATSGTIESREYISQLIRNNLVGETETETFHPIYKIKRITASAFVDNFPSFVNVYDESGNSVNSYETRNIVKHIYEPDGVTISRLNAFDTGEPNKLTEEDIESLEEIVKQAISYNDNREGGVSDEVTVVNFPFNILDAIPPELAMRGAQRDWKNAEYWRDHMFDFIILLAVVLGFFMIVRPIMRVIAPKPMLEQEQQALLAPLPIDERILLEREEEVAALPIEEEELDALPEPEKEAEDLETERVSDEEQKLIIAEENENKIIALDDEILQLAKEMPTKVPLILRSWIEG